MTVQTTKAKLTSFGLLILVGVATLVPDPGGQEMATRTPVWCLICGDHGSIDVIMNVLLFAPLGAAWFYLGWPLKRVALAALTASLTIELLQMWVIAGRDASLSDLVTNTLGAILGYQLAIGRRAWLWPTPGASFRFFILALVVWIGITALTAAGLTPESSGKLYGQWAPELGGYHRFGGTVFQATAATEPLPDGPYQNTEGLRKALELGTAELRAKILTGVMPERLAPIVTVVNDRPAILLILGQQRESLFFSGRTKSSRFRFRAPHMWLEDAFGLERGIASDIGGRLGNRTISVWAMSEGQRRERSVSLSSNWGWLLLSPFGIGLGRSTPVLSGLWLSLLLLPVSYWMTGITGRRKALARSLLVVGMVGGLVGIPLLAGFDPISWQEWIGALGGVALGHGAWRFSRARNSVASRQQPGASVA